MTIYGMSFVASEDGVCIVLRIAIVHGFFTLDKICTRYPKTKKVSVLSSVNCILPLPFFSPTNLKSILNEILAD